MELRGAPACLGGAPFSFLEFDFRYNSREDSRFRNPYALANPAFATWQGFSSAGALPTLEGMTGAGKPAYSGATR
jgi:hypothetical protein